MTVRELRWSDFDALVKIYYEVYEERIENPLVGILLFDEPPGRDAEVEWFSGLYARTLRGETVVVVAEEDGRAVGSCTIDGVSPRGAGSDRSHVAVLGILVDRRFRGRGIGTALLVSALEKARGRWERVRLSVLATNTRARQLYERVGFRHTGRMEGEIKRGERYIDEELMTLDLRSWRPPPPARTVKAGES